MPGTTPRGFPYPVPADPADVAGAIEDLATAIDADLATINSYAVPRGMAQFLGTVTNTVPGTATSGLLTWQLTDFNTTVRDVQFVDPATQAVTPVTGVNTTVLLPQHSGFWQIMASVQLRTTVPGLGVDMIGVEILVGGVVVARETVHDTAFVADLTHMIDASAGVFLTAGTAVSLRAQVARASGTSPVEFGTRSITLMRMSKP